jgi:hypothetical protein
MVLKAKLLILKLKSRMARHPIRQDANPQDKFFMRDF